MALGAALATAGAGALLGGLSGRGRAKQPKWARDIARRYGHAAEKTFEIPFERYKGLPFADANALLQQGWGMAGNLMNTGYGMATGAQGQFANAMQRLGAINAADSDQFRSADAINQALGEYQAQQIAADQIKVDPITGQQVIDQTSEFMNPYISEVVDRFSADQDINRRRAQVNRGDQFASIGAIGGSAHQLADAATNEAFARTTGNMAAQLRKSGYDDAFARAMGLLTGNREMDFNQQAANQGANLRAAMSNQGADLSAAGIRGAAAGRLGEMARFLPQFQLQQAGTLGNMALAGGRYGQSLISQGYGMGQDQQEYLDRKPAFEYAQWLREREDPYRRLGILERGAGIAQGVGAQGGGGSAWTNALSGGVGGFLSALGRGTQQSEKLPAWLQWMA